MGEPADSDARGYDPVYRDFDSPLTRQLRQEAYGEDIGQHSWVGAEEVRSDIPRLRLTRSSSLLDLGCGPCGPLTFVLRLLGCRGAGIECSASALAAGRARAAALGVENLITLHECDLNGPIPLASAGFDAAIALDVILHLHDRTVLLREVARTLRPGGRFLCTDAAVLTGSISDHELRRRSAHGHTQLAALGFNERALEEAGFRLLETEDRTASVLRNAAGRIAARLAHRDELEPVEGTAAFERENQYLETVIVLARRRALSRMMYLAESRGA
jgi:SAM-dependent methyltransferase